MTFGKEWGWGASKEQSKKISDTYRKAGGNFVDIAITAWAPLAGGALTGKYLYSKSKVKTPIH